MPEDSAPGVLVGASPESKQLLETARCLVVAACTPNVPLTITGLSDATGLTFDAVRKALNSDVFYDLMETQIRQRMTPMLARGMHVMDTLVHDAKVRPGDRINAYRSLIQTYSTLVEMAGKHKTLDTDDQWEKAMATVDKLRQMKKAQITKITTNP